MSLANAQKDDFARRLSNIRKAGSNTMGEVHIGPVDEEKARTKRGRSKATNTVRLKRKNKKVARLGEGSSLSVALFAVFLGGLSMFVGQATAFQFYHEGGLLQMTPPAFAADYLQYAPFAFGGLLALAFGWTFRLMSGLRFIGLAGGFWAAFQYKIQLMQTFPGMYVGFFSKPYVKETLTAAANAAG